MKCSRVMCLVRGDDGDDEAIDTAVSLLSGGNRHLQLVYVIVVDRRFSLEAPDTAQIRRGEQVLRDAEFATGMRSGVRGSMLQSRAIGPVVVREALDFQAEVIVASANILATISKKSIDKDAEYIMTNAPCAVVLVRKPTSEFEATSNRPAQLLGMGVNGSN